MDSKSAFAANKIPGLDHLRAVAIILVFFFHYRLFAHPAWIDLFSTFGWTGVDLFFVLSGYLIANQIFKNQEKGTFTLRTFFIKRFFRILPAYWVVLALYFIIPGFREWGSLAPLWKYLTFTQNIGLDRSTQRAFSHAWSLCIEEQFYFLLPLLMIAIYKLKALKAGPYLLVFFLLAGFAFRYLSWAHIIAPVIGTEDFLTIWWKWMYYPTYNRLDGLLAGIAIAGIVCYYPKLKSLLAQNSNVVLFLGALLTVGAYFLCQDFKSFNASIYGYPLVAIAFGFIVMSGVSPGSVLNKYSSFFTSWIATLSYAIYLIHKATIHFAQDYLNFWNVPANGNIMFFMSVGLTITGALILHFVVEKPFHKIRDRVLKHPRFAVA